MQSSVNKASSDHSSISSAATVTTSSATPPSPTIPKNHRRSSSQRLSRDMSTRPKPILNRLRSKSIQIPIPPSLLQHPLMSANSIFQKSYTPMSCASDEDDHWLRDTIPISHSGSKGSGADSEIAENSEEDEEGQLLVLPWSKQARASIGLPPQPSPPLVRPVPGISLMPPTPKPCLTDGHSQRYHNRKSLVYDADIYSISSPEHTSPAGYFVRDPLS